MPPVPPPADDSSPTSTRLDDPTPSTPAPAGIPMRKTRSRSESIGANLRRVLSFNADPNAPAAPARSGTVPRQLMGTETTIYSALQPFNRPPFVDDMIRERVGMNGDVRPLEPKESISILQIDPEELGLIKEGPALRYLKGAAMWKARFEKTAKRVAKQRDRTFPGYLRYYLHSDACLFPQTICINRWRSNRGELN